MPRRIFNLNRDWRYFRDDASGAEWPEFDDSRWQRVGLPHTFDLPYFRTPEFYVGAGWYRRSLDLGAITRPAAPTGSSVGLRWMLEFDGVFQVAEVFVNGRRVGGHRGGYTGFRIDITDAVRDGGNVLAIRVDNTWDATLAPRAGEHIFSGGIYRDVRLLLTTDVHVPHCGVDITTPNVSRERATVCVNTELRNASRSPVVGTLSTRIVDPTGRAVAEKTTPVDLRADAVATIEQHFDPIADPMLWHPDHPHLYRAVTEVQAGGQPVDRVETNFGIRWFRWTADRGFFLNGKRLYLRGANAHQDHAGWGIGITRAACERDVRLIKDAGFNFVRGAHYPHHPAFADACDRLGLVFWSEATFWGKGGFGPEGYWNASAYPTNLEDAPEFEQSCLDQLQEMIRQNRNHPSIVVWSMTNEAFFTYHLDRAKNLMRRMVEHSRRIDPTRAAAIGGAQRGGVDRIGDVAGYNGDGARLFINPGVPNMVSEYGAISKPHDAFDPFFGDLQPEQFDWRSGQAIWCAFDYGSIAGRQGLKGICDHQRLPKRSWHWYRQHYRGIAAPAPPVAGVARALRLETDRATLRGTDAIEDAQIIVTVVDSDGRHVDANPPVTLTVESGPGEFPTGRTITFEADGDIAIARGMVAIAFRSYFGGASILRASSPGLVDATIRIVTVGEPAWESGVSIPNDERPYTPPVESPVARAALRNAVNVALNRPCRASSERPGHAARQANDGDAATAWLADNADAQPSWTLDLEGFYQLASLTLLFPREGNWRFVVDCSNDGLAWSRQVDRRGSVNASARRTDVFDAGVVARYVRLTFFAVPPGGPAGLAEFEVFGILSVR